MRERSFPKKKPSSSSLATTAKAQEARYDNPPQKKNPLRRSANIQENTKISAHARTHKTKIRDTSASKIHNIKKMLDETENT